MAKCEYYDYRFERDGQIVITITATLAWLCEVQARVHSAGVINKRGEWVRCEKQ